MRDSVWKDVTHTATGLRGQHRPSPIYREYFMDLLTFDGHAARTDAPAAPVTAPPTADSADGKG
ncbi:MAG TPA: hypothetical protein VGE72_30470 [Azospirillum sp.]